MPNPELEAALGELDAASRAVKRDFILGIVPGLLMALISWLGIRHQRHQLAALAIQPEPDPGPASSSMVWGFNEVTEAEYDYAHWVQSALPPGYAVEVLGGEYRIRRIGDWAIVGEIPAGLETMGQLVNYVFDATTDSN